MSDWPRFCELPDELADPATAAAAILPVPYDRASTWKKGADKGPLAILEASHHIEWYDLATSWEMCRLGIATLGPVLCEDDPETLADVVDTRVTELLESGPLPVVLGGDHSVSIGAIRAAARAFDDLTVLQIDAHADTRESYAGSSHVPATGTPEPGGLDWYQVTGLLAAVAESRRVVGFDVVELLPTPGQWASEFLAAKLVYRFLSMIFRSYQPSR
ncbi:MAG: arginase family protein [Acidobacteriota bacterium]